MGENSKIEWTDHTFNPWWGCTKVAAGCTNCYAESLSKRTGRSVWGPNGTRVLTSVDYWKQPHKWNREAAKAGQRRRVFCASMADVFEDWSGVVSNKEHSHDMAFVRKGLFALIDATPNLDWLLLTKRPENIRRMWPSADMFDEDSEHKAYWPNVWLLTSIAEQKDADANVPELLKCRDLVPVLGLSCEPLVGPLDLSAYFGGEYVGLPGDIVHPNYNFGVDWVIIGGESGHCARPSDVRSIRSIRDQCHAARVPCFVKQLGANVVAAFDDNHATTTGRVRFVDKKAGDWSEWPDDLRIREFPRKQQEPSCAKSN